MIITLDTLQTLKKARVLHIDLEENKKAKLSHLGLVENAWIVKKYESPFSSPIAFQIHGTLFSLRKEDASKIEVVV